MLCYAMLCYQVHSDAVWITSSSYTQPTTYSLSDAASPGKQEGGIECKIMYEYDLLAL
jgi:hypothetical protein